MKPFRLRVPSLLALAALVALAGACKSSTSVRSGRGGNQAPLCCDGGVDLSLTRTGYTQLYQRSIEQPNPDALLNAAWDALVDDAHAQGVATDGATRPQFRNDPVADVATLTTAFNHVVADHRGNLDVTRLNYAALDRMAKQVGDSHTQFLPPRLYVTHNKRDAGNLGTTTGITLQLSSEGAPLVLEVDPGSAAADAGVTPGDAVLAIDGRSYASFPPRGASRALEGDDGTRVVLDLRRAGSARTRSVTLTRRTTRRDLVHWPNAALPGNVGYVRIREFPSIPINLQVAQALSDFDYEGTTGVIIDLRDNPGGVVNVLAAIAAQVISQSPLAFLVGRDGAATPIQRGGPFTFKQRLVVLVDEGSASSSELFAAAVQEYGDGLIVGTRTCGCLMGAQFFTVSPNGTPPDQQVGLEISLSRVLTPLQHIQLENAGVVPNIQVAADPRLLSVGRDAQLEAAMVALGVDPATARTATVDIVRGPQ